MYDYNASYLNEQATLLEEFHKIQKYLTENPLYQIYQSSADYVAGVTEYYINEVSVREGSTLGVGDIVLFSNVYYGVITEINEVTQMFTIAQGISFRGATGETGPRGGVGPRGLPGEDGKNGLEYLGNVIQIAYDGDEFNEPLTFNNSDFNRTPTVGDSFLFMYHLNESNLSYIVNGRVTAVGKDTCQVTITPEARQEVTGPAGQTGQTGQTGEKGAEGLSIYLYDGELSSSVTSVTLSQINIPSGRTIKVGDILFSSLASTYGAMSIVTNISGTVDFIGTLTGGGGGGGVSDVQVNGTSIVADGVANIPNASGTQAGLVSTEAQSFSGEKTFNNIKIYSNGEIKVLSANPSYYYKLSSSGVGVVRIDIRPTLTAKLQVYSTKTSRSAYLEVNDDFDTYVLSAPSTWSTGTSGSVTLPSAGLYEGKVADANGTIHSFIVNWDGSTKTMSTMSLTSLTASVANAMLLNISATGVISVSINDLRTADGGTDTSLTISYRKLGIA